MFCLDLLVNMDTAVSIIISLRIFGRGKNWVKNRNCAIRHVFHYYVKPIVSLVQRCGQSRKSGLTEALTALSPNRAGGLRTGSAGKPW